MKTILVIGGSGFIGNCFCKLLLSERPEYGVLNVDVETYAANHNTSKEELKNPNYKFFKTYIRNRDAINKIFEEEKPDVVVSFVAESHVDRSVLDPESCLTTNILGTAVLMDACRQYGIERYHQVSTNEEYGDLPLDRLNLFFHEDTPLHTSSPYSTSKASADLLVLAYHRTYGLPATVSRYSNNYGPYQFPEKLISLIISKANKNEFISIYGERLNVRDWLYVEDLVEEFCHVLKKVKLVKSTTLGDIMKGIICISLSVFQAKWAQLNLYYSCC